MAVAAKMDDGCICVGCRDTKVATRCNDYFELAMVMTESVSAMSMPGC